MKPKAVLLDLAGTLLPMDQDAFTKGHFKLLAKESSPHGCPAFAGQGIGSGMLRDCLIPYVQQHGGTILCLFTNSQCNRLFYQKNGFTEFHSQQFSCNGKQIGNWSYRKAICLETPT